MKLIFCVSSMQIDEQDALDRLLEKDTEEAAKTLCQDKGLSGAKACCSFWTMKLKAVPSVLAMRSDCDGLPLIPAYLWA